MSTSTASSSRASSRRTLQERRRFTKAVPPTRSCSTRSRPRSAAVCCACWPAATASSAGPVRSRLCRTCLIRVTTATACRLCSSARETFVLRRDKWPLHASSTAVGSNQAGALGFSEALRLRSGGCRWRGVLLPLAERSCAVARFCGFVGAFQTSTGNAAE